MDAFENKRHQNQPALRRSNMCLAANNLSLFADNTTPNSVKIIPDMKLFTLFAAAMASVVVASDVSECKKWHPKIYGKINWFCAKTNIVIPSAYGVNGVGVPANGRVWIHSLGGGAQLGCSPPQWVPSAICRSQFYKMCGNHQYMAYYGKVLCQSWYITYAPGAVKPMRGSDGSMWYVPLKKRDAEPLAMPMAEADPDVKKYKSQAEAEAAGIALHKSDASYTAESATA